MKYDEENPYAAPRVQGYSPPKSAELSTAAFEKELLEILQQLEADPIALKGHVNQLQDQEKRVIEAATADKLPRSTSRAAFYMMLICLVAGSGLLLQPWSRELGELAIFVGLAIGFTILVRERVTALVSRRRGPQRVTKQLISEGSGPTGDYEWLIGEGGVVVTTPGEAKWIIPWDHVGDLEMVGAYWILRPALRHTPLWHFPAQAVSEADSIRLQAISPWVSALRQLTRAHPSSMVQPHPWSQAATVILGNDWTVIYEESLVWCEVQSLSCSLPRGKIVEQNSAGLVLLDQETAWQIKLRLMETSAGV